QYLGSGRIGELAQDSTCQRALKHRAGSSHVARRRADERFLEMGLALLPCNPAGSASASANQLVPDFRGVPVFGNKWLGEAFRRGWRSIWRSVPGSGDGFRAGDLG